MSESNITLTDETHRILISSPRRTADRTGLYIIFLLFLLLFILVVYLVYNFISFKRYCSSLKSQQQDNCSSIVPIQTLEDQSSTTITNRLVSDL
jgi:hypothetical protein